MQTKIVLTVILVVLFVTVPGARDRYKVEHDRADDKARRLSLDRPNHNVYITGFGFSNNVVSIDCDNRTMNEVFRRRSYYAYRNGRRFVDIIAK